MDYSIKIEDYLSGYLSGEELDLFKKELITNSELKTEFTLRLEIDTALRDKNLGEFRKLLKTTPRSNTGYSNGINIRNEVFRTWQIAAASLIFVLLAGGMWYIFSSNSYSSDRLITKYYNAPHAVGQNRSVEFGSDDALKEAFTYYQQSDYTNALKYFSTLDNQVTAKFYSGVCYIELEQYQKATDSFEFVVNDKDNLFIEQAEWYLGLIYLMNNDKDKASDQFNKISKADSFYADQAQEILKYLN
jgi:tetratricopeptide (TPR) repeat protein